MNREYLKKYVDQLIKIKDFENFIKLILSILNDKKIRFLIVGAYNTIVCYIFGLLYFKFFQINLTKITIFNVIVTIHSFLTHKFFSFRKKKYCHKEIFRAFISYGSMYAISAILILSLINLGYSQLFAYHCNLVISLILFYLLHSYFTFK